MRLALYLNSIGITPILTGQCYRQYLSNLTRQFQQLSPDQRQRARQQGRMLIRVFGLERAANYLPPIPPNRFGHESFRQKRLEKMKNWPADTPPCPTCKIRRFNLPKKSWPSKQAAEEELAKHKNDPLVIYQCPHHAGFWHLGHPSSNRK